MRLRTTVLVRQELRMLYNQFRSAITTPSMLMFYGITFFGIFFVSLVLSSLVSFAPVLNSVGSLLESTIDRGMLMAALGVLAASAALSGYYGIGPAAIITDVDESVLMPAPVAPHQLFMSRYTRRIVRKVSFMVIGIASILPLLLSARIWFFSAVFLMVSFILFLETNYFIGTVASFFRVTVQRFTSSRLHNVIPIILGLLVMAPTTPIWTDELTLAVLLIPSNAMGLVITELTGIFSLNFSPLVAFSFLLLGFIILFLAAANTSGYEYYEIFTNAKGREETEGRFSKVIRGEVDFSTSRFNDPTMWIILKDFWSRLRTPMQFWKYIYVIVGTIFVVYLNIFHPVWFQSIYVPPALAFAIVPAFLLMMILLIQMSSVTSMLSFADERENVYLLKASPFSPWEIVFAKYVLSLIEVALAAGPMCGFLVYILRIEGYLPIITLAAPLIIIFTATGVTIGAYVPVMTNDPKTLPVPLAFSYPIINLFLGAIMIFLVAYLADVFLILVALPLYTLAITFFFLGLSVRALNSYK